MDQSDSELTSSSNKLTNHITNTSYIQQKSSINEIDEGLFGNYMARTIYMAASLFWCSMFSFSMWFRKTSGDFRSAYGLSAFGAFILFMGSMIAGIYGLLKKFCISCPISCEKWILRVISGFYVVGGLFYFFGACGVAYSYDMNNASYFGGIFFAEQTFVALHSIIAAIDLCKRQYLDHKKWRIKVYNVVFLVFTIIAFCSYAATSTILHKRGIDNIGPVWLALFYFLILISEVLCLVVYSKGKLIPQPIKIIVTVTYSFCLFFVLIGYFIFMEELDGITGRSYFLGIGLFVCLMGGIIASDILWDEYIPHSKYKQWKHMYEKCPVCIHNENNKNDLPIGYWYHPGNNQADFKVYLPATYAVEIKDDKIRCSGCRDVGNRYEWVYKCANHDYQKINLI